MTPATVLEGVAPVEIRGHGVARTATSLVGDLDSGVDQAEDPATSFARDAGRWVRIYTELTELVADQLGRTEATIAELPPTATGPHADGHRLQEMQERFDYHLGFWRGRLHELHGMDLDESTLSVRHCGGETALTRREFQLLTFLLRFPERPFNAERLVAEAWHRPDLSSEQLRLYVAQLRRKLIDSHAPVSVMTIPRKGYCISLDAPA